MARIKKGNKVDGWINLNKPVGMTSNQVLSMVKRALKPQKAGHAGTLDPLACGILPIALGEATKTVPYVQDSFKIYNFEVTWGQQRSTDDAEGHAIATSDKRPTRAAIEAIIPQFIGDIEQTPPQFSAVKIDGERAYDLARDGETVDIKSRLVYIEELEITAHDDEHNAKTSFRCLCGKGTYVRAIARDLGLKLGCFGYITHLERAAVGPFTLENAISLDFFTDSGQNLEPEQALLPLTTALDDIPVLALRDREAARLKNGNSIALISKPDLDRMTAAGIEWDKNEPVTALVTYDKRPVALVDVVGPELHPIRIFNL